ncbi:MAG TPA: DUF4097 family beta strand repeat-containing protein [Longimicrobium sp.]
MTRLTLRATLLAGTLGALAAAHPATAQDRTIDRTFPARPGGTLNLDLRPGGSVRIEGWDRDEVRVEGTLGGRDWREERVAARATPDGVEVRVWLDTERHNISTSNRFEVHVPRRYAIRLSSGGGDVSVHGVQGNLEGSTGGGEITLDDVSGTARLSTGGGEIHVTDSDLEGDVSTGGGDVVFRNVSGGLRGRTGGGSVTHDGARASGSTRRAAMRTGTGRTIETGGGDIRIPSVDGDLRASTGGGDITVGTVDGGVRATTGGGDVQIGSAAGDLELRTGGGSVTATLVRAADVDITSGGGEVTLTIPRGMGAEVTIETSQQRNRRRVVIDGDFPLRVTEDDDWDDNHRRVRATGRIGNGEHRIVIRTAGADVHLRAGSR